MVEGFWASHQGPGLGSMLTKDTGQIPRDKPVGIGVRQVALVRGVGAEGAQQVPLGRVRQG